MTLRAPILGWSILMGAALAASFGPLVVQLGFAVIAIGVIGMAHGASDLAIVERRRRPVFLLFYGLASVVCLLRWTAVPAVALPLFLLASAIHFGFEDAPEGHPIERVLRGTSLIATPATLHQAELVRLLSLAGGQPDLLPKTITLLAAAGGVAAVLLIALAIRRLNAPLALGTLALLTLPPLIGFSIGFLALHALPQTICRQRRLGHGSIAYLRHVAPILLAAGIMTALIGAVLLRVDASGVRGLFAAIAALAVPHLLITPWFDAPKRRSGQARTGRHAPALTTI